jgi:hypothetical protein
MVRKEYGKVVAKQVEAGESKAVDSHAG